MPRSLLIVAAGPLQVPAIEEARQMGLRTVVVDANPLAPGMALADAAYAVDILDAPAVEAIARRERASGVMTLCTDAPVRTVAAVARALNRPALSPDAAANATDKRRMRACLAAANIPVPEFRQVTTVTEALAAGEALGYPIALKAPCSSGSRGVYRIESPAEWEPYLLEARNYQASGALLTEEWMLGDEVSVEGLCHGELPCVVQVTDKLLFEGRFPVEAGHSQPSRLAVEVVTQIRSVTESAVRALGFADCAFHAELKITDSGPKVVEIGARLGGDRISTHLTPLSTGVNMVRAAIQIAMGDTPDLEQQVWCGSAVRYFRTDGTGVINRIDGLDQIASRPGLELLYAASERDGPLRPGLVIHIIRSSLDRYGHVVFSGKDAHEACARADQAVALVKFHLRHLLDPTPAA